jgi:hypothetical protein
MSAETVDFEQVERGGQESAGIHYKYLIINEILVDGTGVAIVNCRPMIFEA